MSYISQILVYNNNIKEKYNYYCNMLNHNNSNSNDPMESSEKKNIDKIIKEDIKSMDILFPKYDKYYTNLNVLILYSYGNVFDILDFLIIFV
mgnify:CR=1 FL=1